MTNTLHSRRNLIEDGRLVAAVVAGSWRCVPPPVTISTTGLEQIRANVLKSASAGLAWWTLRESPLSATATVKSFRQAVRLYTLRSHAHERDLLKALRVLRGVGIEPLLAKGWAVARLYPHAGLRPYGDLDLCVRKTDYEKAAAALQGSRLDVDLHWRFRELDEPYEQLFAKSIRVPLKKTFVHVLSPEHHLRLLAIHMLYHGGWKPVWLCDVALMIESTPENFDWQLCLGPQPRKAGWVLGALGLAHHLLGADLPVAIEPHLTGQLPQWMPDALLQQWGQVGHYMRGDRAADLLREGRWMETIRGRWPNPLQATIRMGAAINDFPRLPFQLADALKRAGKLVHS